MKKRVHLLVDQKQHELILKDFKSFTVGIENLIAAYAVGKKNVEQMDQKDSLAFLAFVTQILNLTGDDDD